MTAMQKSLVCSCVIGSQLILESVCLALILCASCLIHSLESVLLAFAYLESSVTQAVLVNCTARGQLWVAPPLPRISIRGDCWEPLLTTLVSWFVCSDSLVLGCPDDFVVLYWCFAVELIIGCRLWSACLTIGFHSCSGQIGCTSILASDSETKMDLCSCFHCLSSSICGR